MADMGDVGAQSSEKGKAAMIIRKEHWIPELRVCNGSGSDQVNTLKGEGRREMEEGSNCLNPLGKMREDRREKREEKPDGRGKMEEGSVELY
jgi:hypothetical protein